MRSNVLDYSLIAPPTLSAALEALASTPGLTPIAGGTELMVALAAGHLPQKHLISINHLRELRFIDVTPSNLTIGSGTTYTDIRRHPSIAAPKTPTPTSAAIPPSPSTSPSSYRPPPGPAASPIRTAAPLAATSSTPRPQPTRPPRCSSTDRKSTRL